MKKPKTNNKRKAKNSEKEKNEASENEAKKYQRHLSR